jgi:hypothetical protein
VNYLPLAIRAAEDGIGLAATLGKSSPDTQKAWT